VVLQLVHVLKVPFKSYNSEFSDLVYVKL